MPDWGELSGPEVFALLGHELAAGRPAVSGFLDTHQYAALPEDPRLQLNGGYPDAQFRRAALETETAVSCWTLRAEFAPDGVRSVRELRGLLRRTLPAESIGDIHWGTHIAIAAAAELDLTGVLPRAQQVPEWAQPEVSAERGSAAGPRIDSAVATLFRVSRAEAQTAIEYGFVFLNFKPVLKRTEQLRNGDQLVFRTKGRIEIAAMTPNPRSGRTMLEFRRFPAG